MDKRVADLNYRYRNDDIKEFFRENGLECNSRCPRDIRFGNVWISDQVKCFAIYAVGTESEKDIYLKIFEKYSPIAGSVKKNPEPKAPRKCCARWEHSSKDYEIMINVVKDILSASGE